MSGNRVWWEERKGEEDAGVFPRKHTTYDKIFGRLELVLMNWEGRQMGEHETQYWRRGCRPKLIRAFREGRHSVAREASGVQTTANIKTEMTKLQRIFDKRKEQLGGAKECDGGTDNI